MRLCLIPLLIFSSSTLLAADKPNFKRWEKTIAGFERQDKKQAPPKNAILFVGSSSIRLWKLEKSFPDRRTINRGFGGSEIADSTHFAPRIIFPHEPRVVVLYAGDNDIARGKSPQQVFADFQTFVKTLHTKLPKTRILFLAIKPSLKRWALAERMKKANTLIKDFCARHDHLTYVDIYQPMLGKDGKPQADLFRKDGLHLNDKGYELWATILRPKLKESSKK